MAKDEKTASTEIRCHGDITIVNFLQSRILDTMNVNEVGAELLDLVEKRNSLNLVLDFSNVEYLSSGVLGKLIALYKRTRERNGAVALCGIRDSVLDIFKITRLDKVFEIFPSQDEAVAGLESRALAATR